MIRFKYVKPLFIAYKSSGGRTSSGRQTCRLRIVGLYNKTKRILNYSFLPLGIPGIILKFGALCPLEKNYSLVLFRNGLLCYYPRTSGTYCGDFIDNASTPINKYGCGRPLYACSIGMPVHHICERFFNSSMSRSFGSCSKVLFHYLNEPQFFLNGYSLLKLPSGEHKLIKSTKFAFIGYNYGFSSVLKKNYKASDRLFVKKRRSIVRGVAKNPVDHPHGGGEGKTSGGRPSTSPWGWLTKGPRTRRYYSKKKLLIRRTRRQIKRKFYGKSN